MSTHYSAARIDQHSRASLRMKIGIQSEPITLKSTLKRKVGNQRCTSAEGINKQLQNEKTFMLPNSHTCLIHAHAACTHAPARSLTHRVASLPPLAHLQVQHSMSCPQLLQICSHLLLVAWFLSTADSPAADSATTHLRC